MCVCVCWCWCMRNFISLTRYRCLLFCFYVRARTRFYSSIWDSINAFYRRDLHITCYALDFHSSLSCSCHLYRSCRKKLGRSLDQYIMANEIDIINILVRVRIPVNFQFIESKRSSWSPPLPTSLLLFNGLASIWILHSATFCNSKISELW